MSKKQHPSPIKALSVAQYFLQQGEACRRKLTNKKLQKLLYYSQAWSLAIEGYPIFNEDFEAWIHGPVIPAVYHHYKKFGFGQITDNSCRNPDEHSFHKGILDEIWRVYGKFDADYLELLTHNEDPWVFARSEIDATKASKAIISKDSMLTYYSSMLSRISEIEKEK